MPSGESEIDFNPDAGTSGEVCIQGTIEVCGDVNEPCCANQGCLNSACCVEGTCIRNGLTCPDGSGTCTSGRCGSCGGLGALCCNDGGPSLGTCAGNDQVCRIYGFFSGHLNSNCLNCGGQGQDCCPNQECPGGGCCVNDHCLNEGSLCFYAGVDAGVCQAGSCGISGGVNEPLLPSVNGCTAPYAFPDVDAGLCVACGGSGEPCCGETVDGFSYVTCGSPYQCTGYACGDAGCQGGSCQ